MVDKPPPPTPTATVLHDAALRHLARYATTQAGLLRVLDRRIMRWARLVAPDDEAVGAAKAAARAEIIRLANAGLLNDAAFAATRAQSLSRAGKSRRGIAAHLAVRGVAASVAQDALPDDPDAELAAAIALARRRHNPLRAWYNERIRLPRSMVRRTTLSQREKQIAADLLRARANVTERYERV